MVSCENLQQKLEHQNVKLDVFVFYIYLLTEKIRGGTYKASGFNESLESFVEA